MRILIAIMFFVSAVLSACGDGAQTQSGPSPTLAGKAELQNVKPAQMVSLSLKELGLPAGADKVTPSGAVSNALLKDGQLRFSTPGDTGKDQEANFEIKSGPTTSQFHVLIRSQRPTSAGVYGEFTDDPPPPNVVVDGLGANNVMTGAPLTFRLQGVPTLDLKEKSIGEIPVGGDSAISVHLEKFWSFNPADSSFSISGPAMQRILDALPNGSFWMHLYFSANDGEFAAGYEMLVSKAETRLSGNLLSERGDPVTSLAGREVLLNGVNTRTRAVAVLDANGAFAFEHVLPDVYFLTLSDLHYPNVVSTSFPIYEGSTQAKVTMVVPPGLGIDTGAKAAAQRVAAPGSSAVRSSVTQDGKEPPSRDIPASKRSSPAAPLPADGDDRAVFSVTAAEQDRPVSKNIDFEVPAGTKSVDVRMTVLTEESRASAKNRGTHVDSWSYSVVGLPDSGLSASGLVDQMYGTDRIAERACVNVSKQTKNAALKISGSVSATNIGDDLLPTTTTVELTLECMRSKSSSSKLEVVSAQFLSPNKNSRHGP
ncbi:carboxypeptidase-like regulatory domain-containing protein [Verminephrobacter aporrectodeae]|nr:carboxypeptidase-like regulatory domain-containing protein [Verminephrobacter aporrectodeae]